MGVVVVVGGSPVPSQYSTDITSLKRKTARFAWNEKDVGDHQNLECEESPGLPTTTLDGR